VTKLIPIFLALTLLTSTVAADDAGTTSPFEFGAGSRELASGGSILAVPDGATSAYWNPSALARAERISLSGLHVRLYESGVAYQYLGFAWPTLDFGAFGFGVFRLGVDGIEKRDANNFLQGETDDSRLAFYLAYGRHMNGYQVGGAITMEHHSLDNYSSSSSPGLNLAISRRFDFGSRRVRSLSLAAVGRNLIRPGIKLLETTVEYPMAAELGLSVELVPKKAWQHTVLFSLKLTKTELLDPKFSLGLDYSAGNILAFRAGLRDNKPSVGVGLSYGGIDFDYAMVDRDLGALHLFTLSSSFGVSVVEKREQRELVREAEFNNLMSDRLTAGKRQMVGDLAKQGQAAHEDGDLVSAADYLDRALFMARAIGMDTVTISGAYNKVQDRLEVADRKYRYSLNIDSAQARLQVEDYLGVQFFANMAIEAEPGAPDGIRLLNKATAALEATSTRVDRVAGQLAMADSLLSGGRVQQAIQILEKLMETEAGNDLVRISHKRAVFEQLRNRITRSFDAGDIHLASRYLDSAMTLFPAHQWCQDMLRRLNESASVKIADETPVETDPRPQTLSRELLHEVETTYKAAMEQFKAARLTNAIAQWERVERLAPDFKSVRKYLINAYKFVGVEEYGKGNLQQAVEIWEKALKLESGNTEIIGYLERARTEIIKLREFSYDDQ